MLRMVPKLHPTIHDVVYTKAGVGGVLGSNLGSADYSQRARPGSTGCEISKWVSDSSIGCLVSAGVGGGPACVGSEAGSLMGHCGSSLMVTIVDSLVSTTSQAFAYLEPLTSSIFPKNGPTAGGYFVQVSGLYFGTSDYSATLQLENRICEATVWVSDTVALCKVSSSSYDKHVSSSSYVRPQCGSQTPWHCARYHPPHMTRMYPPPHM